MFNYVLIVTGEENRSLDYYSDHPEEGLLQDIVFGDKASDLMKGCNEGLFYQLYDRESGKRIGYGSLSQLSIEDDIQYFNMIQEKKEK